MSRVKVLLGGALGVLTLGAVALSNGSVSAAAGAQGSPQRLSPEILYPDNQDVLPSLRHVPPIAPDWNADLQEKDTHEVKRWASPHSPLTPAQMNLVKDGARQAAKQLLTLASESKFVRAREAEAIRDEHIRGSCILGFFHHRVTETQRRTNM